MGPDSRCTPDASRARARPLGIRRAFALVGVLGATLAVLGVPTLAGATPTGAPAGTGATPGGGAPPVTGAPPAGAAAAPLTSPTLAVKTEGYWLVASDGGIFTEGGVPFLGSMGGAHLNQPIVGIASTPTGQGYWEVASDGGIFTFGNAGFHGSMGGSHLNQPIVGMASTPTGQGYWEVASDGGIFTFGTARFYGSMGGSHLNKPIVGMTVTPTGGGYWEVASDGGIFSFGNAQFYGSTGGMTLNKPIVGMAATPSGGGYWLLASDGGMFTFGSATYYGSLGGVPEARPIAAIAPIATGKGYWISNDNGSVTPFGSALDKGSAPQVLNAPIVGMAVGKGNGDPGVSTIQSGSYGYDISNYQCPPTGSFPPAPHQIGVVEVVGNSFGTTNRCLATEASWAGAGLNLYVFLTFGTATSSADGTCASTGTPGACNYGYNAALDAYAKAQNAGVYTAVPWWFDVETSYVPWSSSSAANDALIQGAIQALSDTEGLNTVGIYTSPGVWPAIAGTYRPSVPYWAADWAQTPPGTLCATINSSYADIPSGPLAMVQYGAPSWPYPAGGLTATNYDNDYAC